jgi:hypothetical protein
MIGEMKIDQQSGYKHVRQLITKTAIAATHTAGLRPRQIPNETVSVGVVHSAHAHDYWDRSRCLTGGTGPCGP